MMMNKEIKYKGYTFNINVKSGRYYGDVDTEKQFFEITAVCFDLDECDEKWEVLDTYLKKEIKNITRVMKRHIDAKIRENKPDKRLLKLGFK